MTLLFLIVYMKDFDFSARQNRNAWFDTVQSLCLHHTWLELPQKSSLLFNMFFIEIKSASFLPANIVLKSMRFARRSLDSCLISTITVRLTVSTSKHSYLFFAVSIASLKPTLFEMHQEFPGHFLVYSDFVCLHDFLSIKNIAFLDFKEQFLGCFYLKGIYTLTWVKAERPLYNC